MQGYNTFLSGGRATPLTPPSTDNTNTYPEEDSFISPFLMSNWIEEFSNVLSDAGLTFDATSSTQLLTAIQSIAGGGSTYTINTGAFTASFGSSYLCDVEAGGFTVTLPLSPSAGDDGNSIVFMKSDPALNGNTLTFGRNGETIMDIASDLDIEASDGENIKLTFIWDNTANTWKVVTG
jgi:hypothetical protein